MVEYELAQLIRLGSPVVGGILCLLIGGLIVNRAWKTRIHRYAKADIIQIWKFSGLLLSKIILNAMGASIKTGSMLSLYGKTGVVILIHLGHGAT